MHNETQVMNDEDNANDEMTNGSRGASSNFNRTFMTFSVFSIQIALSPTGLSHPRILRTGRLGRLSLRTVAAVYDRWRIELLSSKDSVHRTPLGQPTRFIQPPTNQFSL